MMLEDHQARRDALNPAHSFIVQAPAGSGKTELLTQRYLSLLGQACTSPEEIIAITFTRKAAAEMRERVLSALQLAQDPEPPASTHRLTAWQLARAALVKDHEHRWDLLNNPQRLRILTIDALCSQLGARLPLLAGYGAPARIVADALPYYQQAVCELMTHSLPVELLAHLDNNANKLMALCVELLGKREQWLPYIMQDASSPLLRRQLEQGLSQLATEILQAAQQALPPRLTQELLPLLRFAATTLKANQPAHRLSHWLDRTGFPKPVAAELEAWRGLAQTLLTGEGEYRKTIDIRNGFPPKSAEKTAMLKIYGELADNEIICAHLRQIQECPPPHYDDSQWQMLTALMQTLPLLAAQLQLIFQQQGVMDFIEMGLSASRALGEDQQPTDLALALDYRIRHLLVDEFQDTSVAQFKLLEKLLLGWEPGDGRSIFLVGDPMQSIYRFRNAEVGLFLRTIHQGMQNIPLTPLVLSLNFRSGEKLIAWFNQYFPQILPGEADLTTGAIPYTPATATQPQDFPQAVSVDACGNDAGEAQQVVQIIQQCRLQNPQGTIAVLVRSRSHLRKIIPALQAAQIKFQAVEIEPLAQRSEIQDLAALTRALHHRADRIAWLAVLRAPYCGLTLADLHVIAQAAVRRTIYEILLDFPQLTGLSSDGEQRLRRITPVLSQALFNRGRLSLVEWIEGAWLALGGPAGLNHPAELANAQTYFQSLMELEQENSAFTVSLLSHKLGKLFAAPDPQASAGLQIMTIHKAKGLEFDHVILPGLQRKPAADDSRLFLWMERASAQGGSHLILAPIKAAGADSDPMYAYLKQAEQQKLLFEAERLLYVAATRAKQSLHLLAVLPDVPDIKSWQPASGSFLQMLWPYFREQLLDAGANPPPEVVRENVSALNPLQRLAADWQLPALPDGRQLVFKSAPWATGAAQAVKLPDKQAAWVGTVIHEALADLAQRAPHFPDISADSRWERRLRQWGMPADQLADSLRKIRHALHNTLQDSRGLWILSALHQDRRNEYALSAVLQNQITHIVIDRTFIDAEGIRWIIDYKTGDSTDADMNAHYNQLTRYAQVIALQESRPIRLGLYFPLSGAWQEWDYPITSQVVLP